MQQRHAITGFREFGLSFATRSTVAYVFGQRLSGDEAFLANRTLISKIARMILHMITQLNGRRERLLALLALKRSLFVVHEFNVLLKLIGFRISSGAKHTNVRPIVCVRAAMVLLQVRFSRVRCTTFLGQMYFLKKEGNPKELIH